MTVSPIATFHSPITTKFGVPRQSGIVESLRGEIVFLPEYRNPDFIRRLEEFDYIWLLWLFSANSHQATHPTVRPPLLGGPTVPIQSAFPLYVSRASRWSPTVDRSFMCWEPT